MHKCQINILYAKNEYKLSTTAWENYINKMPTKLKNSIHRYVRWQDRQAHLLGKLLLRENLQNFEYDADVLNHIEYNRYGKPHIPNTIRFSISHSQHYTICAATKESSGIGIDIEKIIPCEIKDFSPALGNKLIADLINSTDPLSNFFHVWTALESAIKANGRGLSVPPQAIKIEKGSILINATERWFQSKIVIDPHYICHLSTTFQNPSIKLCEMNFFNEPLS